MGRGLGRRMGRGWGRSRMMGRRWRRLDEVDRLSSDQAFKLFYRVSHIVFLR